MQFRRLPKLNSTKSKIFFAGIFAVIGVILLITVHAAVAVISLEAEDGTLNGATAIMDTAASKGKAAKFGNGTTTPPPSGTGTIHVSTTAELKTALTAAKAGDTISLADGTYSGNFTSIASGTSTAPIVVTGSRNAIIDGGSLKSGYTFSLGTKNSAHSIGYWKLEGFTLTGGQKGIIFDNVQNSVINNVYIHNIGEEGIHLRNNSGNNTISNSTVTLTGQDTQAYGEGIYIGSAVSNWSTFSQGAADHSNNNQIIGNSISKTGAENMDIKEGTHNGLIQGNHLDGSGMCWDITASCNFGDSLIDMKGNNWRITGNIGAHMHAVWEKGGATNDGFQNHVISGAGSEGSGNGNVFSENNLSDLGGYGFNIQSSAVGVVVTCSNTVTNASSGFGNVTCTN